MQRAVARLRPFLFVDVDGVLNPYAGPRCPDGFAEHDLFPGEQPIRLAPAHGQWLHVLAARFDLVWGTAWDEHDRSLLTEILQLPPFVDAVTLPSGVFDPREKVHAVDAVAGDRPAAWIDDLLTDEAWDWASRRAAPTLLVPIDPSIGLAEADAATLIGWADDRAVPKT